MTSDTRMNESRVTGNCANSQAAIQAVPTVVPAPDALPRSLSRALPSSSRFDVRVRRRLPSRIAGDSPCRVRST